MINKLELAWETYEFYTNEVVEYEEVHMNTLKTLKRFVSENTSPKKYQRDRVKSKCKESCSKLFLLYQKQIDALSDLIDLNNTYVDIPPEREVDTESLITLKNVTVTLMNQTNEYKKQIEEML
jgi:hypothetical protein